MLRDRKKPTLTPPRSRTTRRSIPPPVARESKGKTVEPATSTRTTIRDLSAAIDKVTGPARGRFSAPGARDVAVDAVSGSIDAGRDAPRTRRRTNTVDVELVMATKHKISVRVDGQTITLEREPALTLAQIIVRVFG
jgi:hypothetical protein